MKPLIMIKGSSHEPPRFWFGRVVTQLEHRDDLLKDAWLIHEHSETEMARLLDLGGEGCVGDWKDKFTTMYGKEITREEKCARPETI
jgi:hypothetical protein